jgi:hypothetical protein
VSAETAFRILNLVVLPWWGLFLAAPRSRLARRAASHGGVFLALAATYGVLLAAAIATGPDAGFGYEGLRAALGAPVGFLAGWTHYLVFDLFVGAWVLRESSRIGVEPRPYLLLTLLAGPLGLGSFLVRRWLRLRSLGQIGGVDLI